jgi:hypothetical protein
MNMQKSPKEIETERENMRRLYLSIGQFIFEFSQLEFMIRHLLGESLSLDDETRFHAVTSPYDFAALCRVTRGIALTIPGCTEKDKAELEDIFKSCLKVNNDRVHVAHGTWFISEEGLGTRHVSRTSLEPKVYYSRISDIDKVSQEIATLKSRIVQFLIGPKSDWPTYAAMRDRDNQQV